MAEVLLRVADKVNADVQANALCAKAGDVICVQPDGWGWTAGERAHPDWVIVRLPGVSPDVLLDMLEPDRDGLGRLLRKRSRKLDLTAPVVVTVLAGLDPQNRVVTVSNASQRLALLAARVSKPAIVDPVVLG